MQGRAQSRWVPLVPCVQCARKEGLHCFHSAKVALSWNCLSSKVFLSPWTGCDNEGEGCGEKI